MHILKLYFKVAKRFRKMILLYTLIFSSIFIVVSSFAQGTQVNSYADVNIKVAFIDHDQSVMSKNMKAFLQEHATVVPIGTSETDQKDALFYQQVKVVITAPKGFGQAFLKGIPMELQVEQLPNDAEGSMIVNRMSNYLNTMAAYKKVYLHDSIEKLHSMVSDSMMKKAEVRLQNEQKSTNFTLVQYQYYFNYLSYVLFSIICMIVSLTMHSIFKSEVMKRNLISPMKTNRMNLQLLLGNLAVGVGIWLLFIIIMFFLNSEGMTTAAGWIMAGNAFLFMLMCVSLAFLFVAIFSNTVHADEAINGIITTLGLATSFLGGAFVPQYIMGAHVLQFSRCLPTYWYVKLNDLIGNGGTSAQIQQQLFVTYGLLILFTIAFLGIALALMKSRKKQNVLVDTTNA